jgi:hypothetical protein
MDIFSPCDGQISTSLFFKYAPVRVNILKEYTDTKIRIFWEMPVINRSQGVLKAKRDPHSGKSRNPDFYGIIIIDFIMKKI